MGIREDSFRPGHFITEEVRVRTTSASLCQLVAGGGAGRCSDLRGGAPAEDSSVVLRVPKIKLQRRNGFSMWHAEETAAFTECTKPIAVHLEKNLYG